MLRNPISKRLTAHRLLNQTFFAAAAAALFSSTAAHADIFDINSTGPFFGVTNGSTYDWWGTNFWSDGTVAANDAGTAATVTWQGTSLVSEKAFFVGSGVAGENYTVRLGSTGATDTYIQNLALNVNAAGSGALTGAAGNVTIGNTGDAGILVIRAANSFGAQNSGTLTINSGINLNAPRQFSVAETLLSMDRFPAPGRVRPQPDVAFYVSQGASMGLSGAGDFRSA